MNKFFTIIISIALLSFFGYFYLYPSYTSWQEEVTKLEEAENKLQTRNKYFEELKKLDQKLGDYQKGMAKVESALPDHFSEPKLYNYLEKRASQKGLVVQEISSKKVKGEVQTEATEATTSQESADQLERREISISVSGPYTEFKDFVKELENSARLFSVMGVKIEAPKGVEKIQAEEGEGQTEEGEEPSQTFSFSIQLKVYSY